MTTAPTLPHTASCQCTAAGVCGRLIPVGATICAPCEVEVHLHYGADPALLAARLHYLQAVALEAGRPGAVGAWAELQTSAAGNWPEALR